MMIHFADLPGEFQAIKEEIFEAITPVMESGQFALGIAVEKFEKEFATYCKASHAIGVNSGTSALHLALLASGVGEGDEVITASHTFIATVAAIRYTGAKPVFVEVAADTYNIDPNRIEEAITEHTRAIIPIHLYGRPADMDPILEIARSEGLSVRETQVQPDALKSASEVFLTGTTAAIWPGSMPSMDASTLAADRLSTPTRVKSTAHISL